MIQSIDEVLLKFWLFEATYKYQVNTRIHVMDLIKLPFSNLSTIE